MKKLKITLKAVSMLLAISIFLASCSSMTVISSSPSDAKVYLDGEFAGNTPYSHRDSKIVGSTTDVRIEKEGFKTFTTSFSKDERVDVGAIVGGVFFLFPFLWTMKYKPTHTYELTPSLSSK